MDVFHNVQLLLITQFREIFFEEAFSQNFSYHHTEIMCYPYLGSNLFWRSMLFFPPIFPLILKLKIPFGTPLSWSTSGWKATSIATNYIKFSSFLWAFTWYHSWKEVCGSKSYIFKFLMNYFLKLLSALIGGKFIFTKKFFTRDNLVKDFFVKINFQPMRAQNL